MEKLRDRGNAILRVGFSITALMICLLAIFPDLYFVFNVAIVLLLLIYYLLCNQFKVKLQAVVIAVFAAVEVVLTQDLARVSIFIFYLFLYTAGLYEKGNVKRYIQIMALSLFCVLLGYVFFNFNAGYDRVSWDFYLHDFFEEKALGFTNPNRCMLYVFCLSCLILANTSKVRHYFFVLAANYVLYLFTRSRTFFFVMIALVLCLLVFRLARREGRCGLLGRCVPLAFLILLALSVILPIFFANTDLNELFSRRLIHNKAFLETGLTLLGNSALESVSFDSSYLHMLLTKGVLFLAVYTFLLIHRMKQSKITNKQAVLLIGVFCASFMEAIFLEYNIMFLIGLLLNISNGEERNHVQ